MQNGVFICPSCQSVVQSEGPLEKGVTCSSCLHEFGTPEGPSGAKVVQNTKVPAGSIKKKSTAITRDVTAKRASVAAKSLEVEKVVLPVKTLDEALEEATNSRDEETIMPDGSRRVRRHKKRPKKEKHKNLVLFLFGWVSVIAVIVALFKLGGRDWDANENAESEEVLNEKTMKDEIMRRYYPQVAQNFMRFLEYPTNDGREQFISNSAETSLSFARHYQFHPFPKPESQVKLVNSNVIKLSEEDFGIETIWQDEEENKMGAIHLWDGEAWKLDWENFGPSSSEPWSRFRAELGKSEGTFRLLVRKRETIDETENFYLSFYRAPGIYESSDEFRETESPEVELITKSKIGQEFLGLWNDYKEGRYPYGSILARELDPPNHMRITVDLAWERNERDEAIMVLKKIVGVSWFGKAIQAHHQEEKRSKTNQDERALDPDESENTDRE